MTNEPQEPHAGNVMFDLTSYLRVNVWLTGNAVADTATLSETMTAIRTWLAHDEKTRKTLGVLTEEEREKEQAVRAQAQETNRRAAPAPQRAEQAPQRQQPARSAGTGVWCPEHNVECSKTKPEYDKDGDRWYHPQAGLPDLPDGRHVKNCNLYWRMTVDGDGESNEGKAMPLAARQPAAAGRRRAEPEYDDRDIDPDDLPF